MRYSQIQSITDFYAYLQGCSVDNNRIGLEGKSHHSTQSLKNKLQQLIKAEPLFSPMFITTAMNGRAVIVVGLSDQDKREIVKKVNRLIHSVALLESLEKASNQGKPKGLKSKIDRLITRIALHIRYGSQPSSAKLLGKVRKLVTQRINDEIKLTNKSLELPATSKAIVCNSLIALRGQLFSALSGNNIIELSSSFSSSEESWTNVVELPDQQTDEVAANDFAELKVSDEVHVERRVHSLMLKAAQLRHVIPINKRGSEKRSSLQKSFINTITSRRFLIKDSSPEPSPNGESNSVDYKWNK